MRLFAAGATARGPRRSNQDAFAIDLDRGLFVVADGMGGHNAGEVASQLALETVVEFVRAAHDGGDERPPVAEDLAHSPAASVVDAAMRLANRAVRARGQRDAREAGMGTTLVVALASRDRLVVGHVGDSRAYVWRDGRLRQVTDDHTWANAMQAAGGPDAAASPMRHVLTRGIGMDADLAPSVVEQPLAPGERWLLCTDGVHGYLTPEALEAVMREPSAQRAADGLVRAALEAGGADNATAVVLNVE